MDARAKLLETLTTLVRSGIDEDELREMVPRGYNPTALHNLVLVLESVDKYPYDWGFPEIAAFVPAADADPAGARKFADELEPVPSLLADASSKCLCLVLGERAAGDHTLFGYGYLFGRLVAEDCQRDQGRRDLRELRDPHGGLLRRLVLRAGDPADEKLAWDLVTLCTYVQGRGFRTVRAPLSKFDSPSFDMTSGLFD